MNTPDNLLYANTHEWIENTSDQAKVGITDHAQHELTDVVYVDLPSIGKRVAAGENICVVESVKAASDIYSPADGEVVEVNDELNANPALINTDPYVKGWLFKLRLENGVPATLLTPEAYKALIG